MRQTLDNYEVVVKQNLMNDLGGEITSVCPNYKDVFVLK